MPGHVLYGWRDTIRSRDGWVPHSEGSRMGHTHDSKRKRVSRFPAEWSHQQIVDAIRDAVESPDYFEGDVHRNGRRRVWKFVNQQWVYAEYSIVDGKVVEGTLTGFPNEEFKNRRGVVDAGSV